jgi:hypothetical protein
MRQGSIAAEERRSVLAYLRLPYTLSFSLPVLPACSLSLTLYLSLSLSFSLSLFLCGNDVVGTKPYLGKGVMSFQPNQI